MTKEKRTADYVLTDKDIDEIIKTPEKKPCEDAVSRDAIRLKIAEMPKYTDGKKLASIRHLKNFLEKELEEPIEVTQDICRGFTIALECIGSFIKSLPSETPTCKKGRWIEVWDKDRLVILAYKCSECEYMMNINTSHYCPNCGAKMETEA